MSESDERIADLTAALAAERAKVAELLEALLDTVAHLAAAVALLARSPKTAAPSNKMFDQMLRDYAASLERGRAALASTALSDGSVAKYDLDYGEVSADPRDKTGYLHAPAPSDWVLVPRVPTEAMLRIGAQKARDFYSQSGPYPRTKAIWSAMLAAAPSPPATRSQMTEDQIKHMVDRFLGWKLPENCNPDCGISFKQTYNEHMPFGPMKHEPIGTNVFDAEQATALVRYMVEGLPSAPQGQWQPIETAPKDGTHVLVCFADPPYSQHWTFMQRPPTVVHWFGPPDLPGLRAGGWYLSVNCSDSNRIQPTHWRPLPTPPATSGDVAGMPLIYPECTRILRLKGKPYPRTCRECGLGPCKAIAAAQAAPSPPATDTSGG